MSCISRQAQSHLNYFHVQSVCSCEAICVRRSPTLFQDGAGPYVATRSTPTPTTAFCREIMLRVGRTLIVGQWPMAEADGGLGCREAPGSFCSLDGATPASKPSSPVSPPPERSSTQAGFPSVRPIERPSVAYDRWARPCALCANRPPASSGARFVGGRGCRHNVSEAMTQAGSARPLTLSAISQTFYSSNQTRRRPVHRNISLCNPLCSLDCTGAVTAGRQPKVREASPPPPSETGSRSSPPRIAAPF
jgi:hypothetical protein